MTSWSAKTWSWALVDDVVVDDVVTVGAVADVVSVGGVDPAPVT